MKIGARSSPSGAAALDDIVQGQDVAAATNVLLSLPLSERTRLFEERAEPIGLLERLRLLEAAPLLQVTGSVSRMARSNRVGHRARAARLMTVAGIATIDLVRLLYDAKAEVRLLAARGASQHPDPSVIWALVEMLGDPDEGCRAAATASLIDLGSLVTPSLERALDRVGRPLSPAALVAALRVARALGESRLFPSVVRFRDHDDPRVRTMVAACLATTRGRGGADALESMLGDPDPAVRTAAVGALGTLQRWRLAPDIAL
ncbi:MAG TPA: HEAT repeat domain-containing protein, partial [Actinomycetota bacterium]|nr:HEAT repeat domain-containing protein [Actinomycetota bacterium]